MHSTFKLEIYSWRKFHIYEKNLNRVIKLYRRQCPNWTPLKPCINPSTMNTLHLINSLAKGFHETSQSKWLFCKIWWKGPVADHNPYLHNQVWKSKAGAYLDALPLLTRVHGGRRYSVSYWGAVIINITHIWTLIYNRDLPERYTGVILARKLWK